MDHHFTFKTAEPSPTVKKYGGGSYLDNFKKMRQLRSRYFNEVKKEAEEADGKFVVMGQGKLLSRQEKRRDQVTLIIRH